MKRGTKFAVAGALVAVLATAYGSAAAFSDTTTPSGSAESRAAATDGGSGVSTKVTTSGIASLLSSLTNTIVNPLLTSVGTLPTTLVTAVSSGLTGAGLVANSPSQSQPRPAAGTYPTCGQQGWDSSDCYGPTVPTVSSSLLTLGTGTLQGYATGDSDGYIGAAHAGNLTLGLAGVSLGNLGIVDSSASCGTSTCATTQKLTGGSLLAGHLTLAIANGTTVAQVDGASIPPAGTSVTVAGTSVSVSLSGNLLTLGVQLTVSQLFSALGLSSLISVLSGLASATSTVTVSLTIGPGATTVASGSATAWGLGIGLNLTGDLTLTLLGGLAGVDVNLGGSTPNLTTPNLLSLDLAYSSASAGALPAQWVPPALI